MPKQLSLSNLQVALQKRETKSSSLGFHYISRLAAANIGCGADPKGLVSFFI